MKFLVKTQIGYSLFELMITTIIMGIVMTISSNVLMATRLTSSLVNKQLEVNEVGRKTEGLIVSKLKKAIYYIPGGNNIIPHKILNDPNRFKADDINFTTLPPSASISNNICFIAHSRQVPVSQIVAEPTVPSVSGSTGILSGLNTDINNTQVELLEYDCFYLSKKLSSGIVRDNYNKSNLALKFFSQKGFYNTNTTSIKWPSTSSTNLTTVPDPISTIFPTLQQVLQAKGYSPLNVPFMKPSTIGSASYINSTSFSASDLASQLTFPNASSDNNTFIQSLSDLIGIVPQHYGTAHPSVPMHKLTDYTSSAGDIIGDSTLPSKLYIDDIGFRVKITDDNTVNIELILVNSTTFSKKDINTYRSFTVTPNIF